MTYQEAFGREGDWGNNRGLGGGCIACKRVAGAAEPYALEYDAEAKTCFIWQTAVLILE